MIFPISKYFTIYKDFFNIDIESAIIEQRNFEIIELFREHLVNILHNSASNQELLESLRCFENVIQEEKKYFHKISVFIGESAKSFVSIFSQVQDDYIEFLNAYALVDCSLNLDSNYEHRAFQDLLVEFNNSLAHLLVAMIKNDDEVIKNKNIQKAKVHIYRSVLDAYKEIVQINRMKVNRDIKEYTFTKHTNTEDEKSTFYDYYLKVRTMEAENIGHNEDTKSEIITRYKNLATFLVNDSNS